MPSSFRRIILLAGAFAATLAASAPPLKFTASLGEGANITAIAVDASGGVYAVGATGSALPATPGAFQTRYSPAMCYVGIARPLEPCPVAFAAKLTPDGTSLEYLTYLGASSSQATGISVDAAGNAWITGAIGTPDLPVTPGALQSAPKFPASERGPYGTSFLLKLDATGSKVLYASYLGDAVSLTTIKSQAIDNSGSLYIAGSTNALNFPVTAGAFQTSTGPFQVIGQLFPSAGFVSKFDVRGALVYSTYFRGSGNSVTSIQGIAVDAAGSAYVTGDQSNGTLPATPGAFQTATTAATSAFIAKMDPTGSRLVYSTYLSGSTSTGATAIAVDAQANAYVTGFVDPDASNPVVSFPVTPGAFQSTASPGPPSSLPPPQPFAASSGINFLVKLNAAGSDLIYSTLLSGSSPAYASGAAMAAIAVDSSGAAVMAGTSDTTDFPPTTPGALFQCHPAGGFGGSGFLMKFAPDGSKLLYSTYPGVSAAAIALDGSGTIYAAISNFGGLFPIVPGSFGETTADGYLVAALSPVPRRPGSVSCAVSAANRGGYTAEDVPSLTTEVGLVSVPAIAPGEVVDIIGYGIGPSQAVTSSVESGRIPTSLAGLQVLFNGFPAPLLSASPNQIRAIVPFEAATAPFPTTQPVEVVIQNPAASVEPFTTTLAPLVPSVFTVDGKPGSQALLINQDGTLNSPENPAPAGSIVTAYATGLNNTVPPMATGSIASGAAPLAAAVHPYSFQVTYAGAAPDCPAGVAQINFRLDATYPAGVSKIYLDINAALISPALPTPWSATAHGSYFFVKGSGTAGSM
ncbi:MAG TPA: hypothetical protein VKX45_16625 [Bryobacteraceae bacterium]|nr:hypothetical protein [Bryobacteraceae bacterium]